MPDLGKITETLRNFSNLKRRFAIFLLGALASLALPPAGLWPAMFVAFPGLVLFLDTTDARDISPTRKFRTFFGAGWWFGFGYFIVSLYWVGAALLVEAEKFALLLPFAVAALPAGLAIFWGLACGVSSLKWSSDSSRLLTLSVMFTLGEWLRGNIFTGFPWNTLGYASESMGGIDQLSAFSGLYGVTFFVVVCSSVPVMVFARRPNFIMAAILVGIFGVFWVVGNQRSQQTVSVGETTIRVVQPNIEQKEKWDRAFRQKNIDQYFKVSATGSSKNTGPLEDVDIMVWPESALPVLYQKETKLQDRVGDLLPDGTLLVMGALRRNSNAALPASFYNSILTVNSNGRIVATYDKFHLVPFGEYLPGEKWLAPLGLRKIVALPGGFSSGTGPKTLKVGQLPAFSTLVCYEIGFSGHVIDQNSQPEWIINVTNDGWFGKTAGPYQHLSQARFRAIEQGLPVVRAANTGISALIDPYGNVIKSIRLSTAGVFDAHLPMAISPTVFSRFGLLATFVQIVGILIILISLSALGNIVQKAKNSQRKDI